MDFQPTDTIPWVEDFTTMDTATKFFSEGLPAQQVVRVDWEIAKGGEAMRKEVDSKLSVMKETGGYIAGLDHLVHVEFTLDKFKEYANYLKERLAI
jgi:hypothetical protein